jgi:hypothetical protein
MLQHRAVFFLENIPPDVNDVIRIDADHEAVEGSVVKFAKGDAVVYGWSAIWLIVRDDMGCIQKLPVF